MRKTVRLQVWVKFPKGGRLEKRFLARFLRSSSMCELGVVTKANAEEIFQVASTLPSLLCQSLSV